MDDNLNQNIFIKPAVYTASVFSKNNVSSKVTKLMLNINSNSFNFIPGQYINLQVNSERYRPYSISSGKRYLPTLSLLVETGHEGLGSNYVNSLKPNDLVTFIGPAGKLLLKSYLKPNIQFFATGTGIAPFISILDILCEKHITNNIFLHFGVRKEEDIMLLPELEDIKSNLPNFRYKIYFSKPKNPELQPQRVTSALPGLAVEDTDFYLCGHPAMVKEVGETLLSYGVLEKDIVTEIFSRPEED